MLKVRKTSWHYRLWKLGRSPHSEPRDLCRYFWHITLIKLLAPLVLASLVLFGVGTLLWLVWGHPGFTAAVVLGALALAGAVLVLFWAGTKAVERITVRQALKRRQPKPPKPPKEPNLMWEMVKAKKRKVCPLIVVIDEKKP